MFSACRKQKTFNKQSFRMLPNGKQILNVWRTMFDHFAKALVNCFGLFLTFILRRVSDQKGFKICPVWFPPFIAILYTRVLIPRDVFHTVTSSVKESIFFDEHQVLWFFFIQSLSLSELNRFRKPSHAHSSFNPSFKSDWLWNQLTWSDGRHMCPESAGIEPHKAGALKQIKIKINKAIATHLLH